MTICRLLCSKRSRKRTARFALLLLALAVQAVTAGPVVLSGVIRTDHFLIRHHPDLRAPAAVTGDACENWLGRISTALGVRGYSGPPIPVFLYRDQREFKRATGYDRPGEAIGLASSSGYVVLDASGAYAAPEEIAGHEIVHILIYRMLGRKAGVLPLWFNEGTARFLTDDWDRVDRSALADAAGAGELLPFSSIARSFPGGDKEGLAYAEGTSAVAFLARTYGRKAVAGLLHELARTGSFEAAVRAVTGGSVEQFESRWRLSIEGPYHLSQVTRAIGLLGLLAMPVLVVAAYLALRRRQKRIVEEYEQEEWERANWRDWGGGAG